MYESLITPPAATPSAPGATPAGTPINGGMAPLSYKDPAWDSAEQEAASKTGVPADVMRVIRTVGERSNGNQVSPKNAQGVYQFIPSTRDLFLKKYGVDAYSKDPKEQALAAAYHLKESFERTGSWDKAMAGYNGGTSGERGTNGTTENREYAARTSAALAGKLPANAAPGATKDAAGAPATAAPYFTPSTGKYASLITPPMPERTVLEAGADLALGAGAGVVQGVGMVAGAFGADNAVARGADKVAQDMVDMQSPARKAQRVNRAEAIRQAEESGSPWAEIVANVGAFAEAPIETSLNAIGTSAPTLLMAFIPGLGQTAAARLIVQGAMGAAQGAGSVKGSIYEAVEKKLIESGVSPDDAAKAAAGAQAYDSENSSQIAGGAILGMLAGGTGIEASLGKIVKGGADGASRGIIAKTALGAAKEAPMEGAQGGQERVASNTALQKQGFDVPTYQGVAGQAAGEAVASVVPGGVFGAMEPSASRAPSAPAAPAVAPGLEPVAAKAAEPNSPLSRAAMASNTPEILAGRAAEVDAQAQAAAQGEAEGAAAAVDPATRLAELEAIGQGTPAAPDGKAPAAPGRFFTAEEKAEYDQLSGLKKATEEVASAGKPKEDLIGARVKEISEAIREGGLLQQLRDEQADTKSMLKDLAIAQSPSTPAAQREQAIARVEFALGFANVDVSTKPAPKAPESDPLVAAMRNPDVSPADREALNIATEASRNPNLPEKTRQNSLDQAREIAGRYAAPTSEAAATDAQPAVLGDIAPPAGSQQESLRQAERLEDGAYQFRSEGFDDEADQLLAEADSAREEAATRQEQAAADARVDAVAAPKVVTPSGAGPAVLRKRKATLRQLVDNGLTRVERRNDGFFLVSANGRQEFKLDGMADAQLARAAVAESIRDGANQANLAPTDGQKAAGNYKKGRVEFDGLKLAIENPTGSRRSGTSPDGTKWETTLVANYGDVTGTVSADGDAVDIYLVDNPRHGSPAFVVDQYNDDGSFDETKTVLGVATEEAALRIYDAGFSDGSGPRRRKAVTQMTVADFGAWAKSPAAKKPAAPLVEKAAAAAPVEANGEFSVRSGGQEVKLTRVSDEQMAEQDSIVRAGRARRVTKAQVKQLRALAGIFGKEIQFFDDAGQGLGDGFVRPGDNATIYLNESTTVSPLAVFGHELTHLLERDMPEAHAAFMAVVEKNAGPAALAELKSLGYKDGQILNELTSDVAGNLMTDGAFWGDVFDQIRADNGDQAQGIIARLAAVVYEAIARLTKAIKQPGFDSAKTVSDAAAVRAAFKDALAGYVQRQGVTPGAMSADVLRAAQRAKRDKTGLDAEPAGVVERSAARADGLTIEAYHFSKAPRVTLTTGAFGTGLKGSDRDAIMAHPDKRLRQRLSFYVNKGTGIRPEAGVGGVPHKATLTNIYDADADTQRLKQGADKRAFESAVLDAGYSGYLSRLDGSQPGQVILLGAQTVTPEILPATTQIGNAAPAPASAARDADVGDRIQANTALPKGKLTLSSWSDVIAQQLPEEHAALESAGVFDGSASFYKDGLVALVRASKIPGASIYDGTLQFPAKAAQAANTAMEAAGSSIRFSRARETTQAFDGWFDGSAVTNPDGTPAIVYHGTANIGGGAIDSFRPSRGLYGEGVYMTGRPGRADAYTYGQGGHIYPLFAAIKNPISSDAFMERFGRNGATRARSAEIRAELEREGYDGVIDKMGNTLWEVVAFRPEQIRSTLDGDFNLPTDVMLSRERPTDGEAFKKWFGDSQAVAAVDPETGDPVWSTKGPRVIVPLRMFHTSRSSFGAFEAGRPSITSTTFGDVETNRHAIFFSPSVEDSNAYGTSDGEVADGANTIPVYLKAERPLDLANGGVTRDDELKLEAAGMSPRFIANQLGKWDNFDDEQGKEFAELVQRAGFDSVIFNDENPDTGDSFEAWAVFQPSQIKSAIGNSGAFDPKDADITRSRARPVPTSIDALTTADASFEFASTARHATNRDFKLAMQDRTRAAAKAAKVDLTERTDANLDYLVRVGLADAKSGLRDNANAVGWYDEKVSKALAIVSLVHPEIATDPEAKFAFIWALAVTSNGMKVNKNFELAEQVYQAYKSTGEFPTNLKAGATQKAINKSLALFNTMKADWGMEPLMRFMTTKLPVRKIEALSGIDITGEGKGTEVYGAAILGPKVGNGFFMNLFGQFDQLTMDRWLMRTWGRWTGSLVDVNMPNVKAKRAQLDGLIRMLGKDEKKAFEDILKTRLTLGNIDGAATAIWKASQKPALREKMNQILPLDDDRRTALDELLGAAKKNQNRESVGSEMRKTGNSLRGYLDGQKEAPEGSKERDFIRSVFSGILGKMQGEFPGLTMADLQAVVWYPEKRLYDAAKTSDDEVDGGYADDEAPDYANAAAALAAGKGVSDASIKQAIKEVDDGIQTAQRAGAAQPAARGNDAQAGQGADVERSAARDGSGERRPAEAPLPGAPAVAGASGPDPRLVAVAQGYAQKVGIDLHRQGAYAQVDEDRARRIADAYEAMEHSPQDPAVQAAYAELIAQTRAQYDALAEAGYEFYFADETNDPYGANPWNAMRDLRANQRLAVFPTAAGFGSGDFDPAQNPLLADTGLTWGYGSADGKPMRVLANDLFRAVHDAFGHGLEGAGFRAQGEENAWQAHVRLFTGAAVGAITTETRGQNSWLNYGPAAERNKTAKVEDTVFADQKTGLLPEWVWSEGRVDDDVQRSAERQTDTPEFKKWFGESKVVDKDGNPKVVYHGSTERGITEFDTERATTRGRGDEPGTYFTDKPETAYGYTRPAAPIGQRNTAPRGSVTAAYLSLQNPLNTTAAIKRGLKYGMSFGDAKRKALEKLDRSVHDGIMFDGAGPAAPEYVAFFPEQIKSATGNSGAFDPEDGDIMRSTGRTSTGAGWDSPSASKFDDMIYKLQDKQIETKRVVDAIKEASGAISDDLNVYLQEEMFHGRAAKRTEDFVNMELNPLVQEMAKDGLKIADVEEFMHARHAKEANAVIAARNPNEPGLQDGGSGMTNAAADAYMSALPAADRAKLEAAAKKVDAIIAATRKLYVDYELESQDTVDAWNGMFKHYIPLQREEKEGNPGMGQGFSIKGRETKGRTGSTRKVVDILANVALQRERAIVRGEKNRVAQSLIGLATANTNPDFWTVDQVPTERVFNPATGLVEDRADSMFKNRENAVVAKIADPAGIVREHAVIFNEEDPRALRMATALKNLDALQLNGLLGASAKVTRYFAAINTQYNPVFGITNLVRDVQGAMVNLSSTPIANDKLKVGRDTMSALRGIYVDARAARKGNQPTSAWSQLWDEFQEVGGQTGFRDLFATSADRAAAIEKALDPTAWMDSKLGQVFTAGGALKVPLAQAQKSAGWMFDILSDYNLALENSVRLAAYKAAIDRGISKPQAASIAKNLTVNFNRKGQVGQQAGALYAFFNAAVQGTARMGQVLFDMEPGKPKTIRLSSAGKKVVYGGMLLGVIQALMMSAAGFNDEDPPEFARERSFIIPLGGKKYVSIPLPLGLHVIPNLGRIPAEFALSGFKDPHKRALSLVSLFADAFNPIGNAGMSMQTLSPTALDPLVALTENKDWAGRPITRESSNKAIPGHALGKDTSTTVAKLLSEGINLLSGGNEYTAGVFSPSPSQLDYLLGQITGGVGRELSKIEQSTLATARGEDLPLYKIPLVGRFVGNAASQASEGSAFYANTDRLNRIETEIKGLQKDGKTAEAAKLKSATSEAYLITMANQAERQIQKLRTQKRELVKDGAPRDQVKEVETKITAVMARLNRSVESLKEREAVQ